MPRFFTADPSFTSQLLPPARGTWSGDRRPLSVPGLACDHLDLVIWVDDRGEELRGATLVPRDAGWTGVLRTLVRSFMCPFSQGSPSRPEVVRYRPQSERIRLARAFEEAGVRLKSWKDSPVLDSAYAGIRWYIRTGPGHTYLDREGLSPVSVGEFFDAAVSFQEAFHGFAEVDAGVFALHGLAERDLFVLVHGGPPKFEVFDSLEDAQADRARQLDTAAAARVLRFTYDDFHHMGPTLLRDIITHRWRLVDSDNIPVLSRFGRTTNEVIPPDGDFRLAATVMRAVIERLVHKKDELELPDGRHVRVDWPVSLVGRG